MKKPETICICSFPNEKRQAVVATPPTTAAKALTSSDGVGDESELMAEITTHMARMRNAERALFAEWVLAEHYRMARAENASSPNDGAEGPTEAKPHSDPSL